LKTYAPHLRKHARHIQARHISIASERSRQNSLTQADHATHGSDQPRIPARPDTHQPIHTDKEHITRHFP
jgi:hypothetical protein